VRLSVQGADCLRNNAPNESCTLQKGCSFVAAAKANSIGPPAAAKSSATVVAAVSTVAARQLLNEHYRREGHLDLQWNDIQAEHVAAAEPESSTAAAAAAAAAAELTLSAC
jgi:hypothetical protein